MHDSMNLKDILETQDVIVHKNPKNRHNYVYCRTCATQVLIRIENYKAH